MRCKNAELLHKLDVPKIQDWLEVTFSLVSDVTNCTTINTRDYVTVNALDRYAMYDRPENRYDCDGGVCTTTGTLYVKAGDSGTDAVFYKDFDATQYASGVLTAYVYESTIASGDKAKITISDTSTFTNADVYEVELGSVGEDGYAPVLVDFTATPTSTEGTGWTASTSGAYIKVEVINGSTSKAFGVSTISFYKSLYELAMSNIVKIGCLSEVGGTFDVGALEETCISGGYDESSLSGGIDRTITGKKLTSNYWMLNPLAGMNRFAGDEEAAVGYRVETVKKTVDSNGQVEISDINQDVCDFIGAQVDDKCVTPVSDLLYRIMAPVPVTLSYDQYQVVHNTETGVSTFYFNEHLAGKDVLITYPQKVDLKERIVGNNDNLNEVRVKMSYPWVYPDGTEEIHTFNNVLITSFPASITSEESEFSFTINIRKDNDGNWFTVQRVL